jgi:hypothetical protein
VSAGTSDAAYTESSKNTTMKIIGMLSAAEPKRIAYVTIYSQFYNVQIMGMRMKIGGFLTAVSECIPVLTMNKLWGCV